MEEQQVELGRAVMTANHISLLSSHKTVSLMSGDKRVKLSKKQKARQRKGKQELKRLDCQSVSPSTEN